MRPSFSSSLRVLLVAWTALAATARSAPAEEPEPPPGPRPQLELDMKPTAIAFSPDGKLLIVAVDDRTVWVCERATGKPVFQLQGHAVPVTAVAISPDGTLLASAGCTDTRPGDFELKLWDLGHGKLLHAVREKEHRSSGDGVSPRPFLTFSPDGTLLALPGKDRSVHLWDVALRKAKHSWSLGFVPSAAAFSPDGKILAIGTCNGDSYGTVGLFDVQAGTPISFRKRAVIYSGTLAVAFSPDGKQVWGGHRRWVYQLAPATGEYKAQWKYPQMASSLAFSPRADRTALVTGDTLTIHDTLSGKALLHWPDAAGPVAFAPDGTTLAAGSKDGRLRIWRPELGKAASESPPTGQAGELELKGILWAALGVPHPLVLEPEAAVAHRCQVQFSLVNDGDKVIDPQIGSSKLFVNDKELAEWPFIVGNGPKSAHFQALPPGEHIQLGYDLGEYFRKAGTYKLEWKGKLFAAPAVVIRVLPAKNQ